MKSTNFNAPKHGAVVHLTTEEADKLEAYWLKNKRKYVSTASIQKIPCSPVIMPTRKYYIPSKRKNTTFYPTTDGIPGWGGTSFKAFSSAD